MSRSYVLYSVICVLFFLAVPVFGYIFCHCDTVECRAAGVNECKADFYCYTMFENRNGPVSVDSGQMRSNENPVAIHRGCVTTDTMKMCNTEALTSSPTLITLCCRDAWCNSYGNRLSKTKPRYTDFVKQASNQGRNVLGYTLAQNTTENQLRVKEKPHKNTFFDASASAPKDNGEDSLPTGDLHVTSKTDFPRPDSNKNTSPTLLIATGLITVLLVVLLFICLCLYSLGQRGCCLRRSLNGTIANARIALPGKAVARFWLWRRNPAGFKCRLDKYCCTPVGVQQMVEPRNGSITAVGAAEQKKMKHLAYENCYCCQHSTGVNSTDQNITCYHPALDGYVANGGEGQTRIGLFSGRPSPISRPLRGFPSLSGQCPQLRGDPDTCQKFPSPDQLIPEQEASPNGFIWTPEVGNIHASATIYSGRSLTTECSQGSQEIKQTPQQHQQQPQARRQNPFEATQFANSVENMTSPRGFTTPQKTPTMTTNNSLFEQRLRGTGATNSAGEESHMTPSNEQSVKGTPTWGIQCTAYPVIDEWPTPSNGGRAAVSSGGSVGRSSGGGTSLVALAQFRRAELVEDLAVPYAQYQLTPEHSVYSYT